MLVSTVMRLKRNVPFDPQDIFQNFTWVGIASAGSASVAALLFLSFRQTGVGVLLAGAPVLVMLLSTLHYYFRQQETAQSAQKTQSTRPCARPQVAARHMSGAARKANVASTAPSRTPRSAWRWSPCEGRVLQANLALESLLGRSADLLIGRRLRRLRGARRTPPAPDPARTRQPRTRSRLSALSCVCRAQRRSRRLHLAALQLLLRTRFDRALPDPAGPGHHRTPPGRSPAAPHRLPRRPDRLAQPQPLPPPAGRRRCATRAPTPPTPSRSMFLDFDRFKLINDSMGHSVGDEFLIAVARAHPGARAPRRRGGPPGWRRVRDPAAHGREREATPRCWPSACCTRCASRC